MVRRLGPLALTIGSLLAAGPASAQPPASGYDGSSTVPAMSAPVAIGASAGNHAAPTDHRIVTNPASFNPYAVHDELRAKANANSPLWQNPGERPSAFYKCHDCKKGSCHTHGRLHGLKAGLRGLGGFARNLGEGEGGPGPDFQVANCWTIFNFEHKTIVDYHYLVPLRTATKVGYGKANGGTIGTEWLKWVSRDDERHFSRWGFLTAFDYSAFSGNRDAVLVSELSGNVLSSDGGNSFGMLFGPTFRTDFFLFGLLRVSPSVSAGLDLSWVTMRETAPVVFPPDPVVRPDPQPTFTTAEGAIFRNVERFKFTDFCIGGYARCVLDVPIHQKLNFGVGMDYRIAKTEAFTRDDDARKHFGLILQLTGEF